VPCRYEPDINRTYQELAGHYGAVVVPARTGKAKDKAKVEAGVLIAQRWILARLRHRTFFEHEELGEAVAGLLEELNARPMQKLGVSRRELWERLDRPALLPLPASRYEQAHWKTCRVNIDYHIDVDHHVYSVPYQLVHESVEARFTSATVEVFYKGRRVASHPRRYDRQPATLAEHMPSSHRAHAEWTPSRLIGWAQKTGPAAGRVVSEILRSRPHPEQGYRACLGLMRLGRRYGDDRLEAACARAEKLRSFSYLTVKNILASAQDHLALEDEPTAPAPGPSHENIRGAEYYAAQEDSPC
jgi:transposase